MALEPWFFLMQYKNPWGYSNQDLVTLYRGATADNIFSYIGEYCPSLKTPDNKFAVNSEDELKLLLYGIEQRFYTTLVGGERRLANSVIPLG